MTMGIRVPTYPLRFSSGTSFAEWLRAIGPDIKNYPYPGREYSPLKEHIALHGKPIVRVPVERQVPNEADL